MKQKNLIQKWHHLPLFLVFVFLLNFKNAETVIIKSYLVNKYSKEGKNSLMINPVNLSEKSSGTFSEWNKSSTGQIIAKVDITNGPEKGNTYWTMIDPANLPFELSEKDKTSINFESLSKIKNFKLTTALPAIEDPINAAMKANVTLLTTANDPKENCDKIEAPSIMSRITDIFKAPDLTPEITEKIKKVQDIAEKHMDMPEMKVIPDSMLAKVECLLITNSTKISLSIGGRKDSGVATCRVGFPKVTDTWSAPLFIHIVGASFGVQAGVGKVENVTYLDKATLLSMIEKGGTMGGEIGGAIGSEGRSINREAEANIENQDLNIGDSSFNSYSRSKGAFLGASLTYNYLLMDSDVNEYLYKKMTPSEILNQPGNKAPALVSDLSQVLKRFSK